MDSRGGAAAIGHAYPWEENVNNKNNSKEQIATQSTTKKMPLLLQLEKWKGV